MAKNSFKIRLNESLICLFTTFFYKTSYWAWKMCMYVVCSLLFVVFMVHWILALVHKHTHSSWYIWFMSPNHRLINNVENRDTRLLQPRSAFIWNQKFFFQNLKFNFFVFRLFVILKFFGGFSWINEPMINLYDKQIFPQQQQQQRRRLIQFD